MASRQAYTQEDDDAMWRYLHQQVLLGNEDALAPMGVKIWKSASESRVTNKSVHSMTCHFRRKLLPAIHRAPLSKSDIELLLSKWSLADQINLSNFDNNVAIEESESNTSNDDVIVDRTVVVDPQKGTERQQRRRRVANNRTGRPAVDSPSVIARAEFATDPTSSAATTSYQPPAKSQRITLADALGVSKSETQRGNGRSAKSSSWPLASMEELEKGKGSLKEEKDVDAPFNAFEFSEPESADFQSKLMALIRQGAVPAKEIETVVNVQSKYVIDLAKEMNISLRVVLGMIIANDEYRNLRKLREALMIRKERARRVATEDRPTQTAEAIAANM